MDNSARAPGRSAPPLLSPFREEEEETEAPEEVFEE
jgi:hypothetical protein